MGRLAVGAGRAVAQQVEAGLANGDAELDLIENDRVGNVVGQLAVDLYAPVHGTGMHDQSVISGVCQLLRVEPPEVELFAWRGHEGALHPFGLQAEHHNDVHVAQALAHIVMDGDAEHVGRVWRQQGGGCDEADLGPDGVKQ